LNVNQVTLGGRLTRDPELRYIPSGTAVCEFGLAINRKYKDKKEVTFVDIVAWGKTGETIQKFLKKGDPIFINGRLTFESWEDRQGNKRNRLKVTAHDFQFVGSRKDRDEPVTNPARASAPAPVTPAAPADDDIPF
jgi:single-strand DNA-binding protein